MPSPTPQNTIYAATPHQNWVIAAEMLRDRCGLKPVYWECPTKMQSKIEESFPDATVNNVLDAKMGILPENIGIESAFKYPIDSTLIEDYASERIIALKMMDRIDPGNVVNKKSFGHNERVRHYYRLLSYWIKQFEHLDPELVIFGSTPHLVNDFVLYSVAQKRDVETIIFRHTSLPETFYLTEEIDSSTKTINSSEPQDLSIPKDIKSHLYRLNLDYSLGKPSYMRGSSTNVGVKSVLKNLKTHFLPSSKSRFKELIFNKNFLRWTVSANITYSSDKVEESEITWIQWLYFLVKSRIYLRKLKKSYNKKVDSVSLSNKYIYFPLHYQPERTTSPEGGHYVDQTIIANLLSNSSDEFLIYIKEHPSQFDPELKGQLGRKKWQYEDIIDYENVRFVPINTDSYELIDNAVAVATVTGTAGWEAINRGTPALVFGSAWYLGAPGVYDIETRDDLEESLESIRELNTWRHEDIDEFVRQILSIGYRANLNEPTTPSVDQAETICRAINDWISS